MSDFIPRPIRVLIVENRYVPQQRLMQLVQESKGVVVATCYDINDFKIQWPKIQVDMVLLNPILDSGSDNQAGWKIAAAIGKSKRSRPIIICSDSNNDKIWGRIPGFKFMVQMSTDASLSQFIATAYPLIYQFYPDAAVMFLFHSGGDSPRAINEFSGQKLLIKSQLLDHPIVVDPQYINFIVNVSSKSMIRIHYQDKVIDFSQTLEGILRVAKYNGLVRINKSTIINKNYVVGRDKHNVYVRHWGGKAKFPISPKFDSDIDDWFNEVKAP